MPESLGHAGRGATGPSRNWAPSTPSSGALQPAGSRCRENRRPDRPRGLQRPVAGVERDPYAGASFVLDDWQGLDACPNPHPTAGCYPVAPLAPWGRDTDALALHPDTGMLFVCIDEGRALTILDRTPSATALPEPLKRVLAWSIA